MKAKQIKKLRKKISKKGYYFDKWGYWAWMDSELETFLKFNCHYLSKNSERNKHIYNKKIGRVKAQCNWYKKKAIGNEKG